MGSFRVKSPGLLSCFQDGGRKGLSFYAIPSSGAMDAMSLTAANSIMGKRHDAVCIEMHYKAMSIQFNDQIRFCITGADMGFCLNGESISLNTVYTACENDVLHGAFAKQNARAYFQIDGAFELAEIYGSQSAFPFQGIESSVGSMIQKGALIEWKKSVDVLDSVKPFIPDEYKQHIKIYKGPEFDCLSARAIQQIKSEYFSIGSDSNRMGARIRENVDHSKFKHLTSSVPVLPGFIQMTPEGQLIVVLQDGQTTGGYPRVAFIKQDDLNHFNQLGMNRAFQWSF